MANIIMNKIVARGNKEEIDTFVLFINNNTTDNYFSYFTLGFKIVKIHEKNIFVYSRNSNVGHQIVNLSLFFPNLTFYCLSATCEDVRALFTGKEIIKDGKSLNSNFPSDESNESNEAYEAYEIFFEIFPECKEEYIFNQQRYIFKDFN